MIVKLVGWFFVFMYCDKVSRRENELVYLNFDQIQYICKIVDGLLLIIVNEIMVCNYLDWQCFFGMVNYCRCCKY